MPNMCDPLPVDGNFRASGTTFSLVVVHGDTAIMHFGSGVTHTATISVGDYGKADQEVQDLTGVENSNVEISLRFGEQMMSMVGVVTNGGKKMTLRCSTGVAVLEWMTEEEAAAMMDDGDPINAPPGPYKVQPENVGKLLWITGPPGLGKSTSAQLLAREHGYVYYEADCFTRCKNPYIPTNVEDPSIAQVRQRSLVGEGVEKRKEVLKKTATLWQQLLTGQEYSKEDLKMFYEALSEDIAIERKRIGGDWAVAGVAMNKEVRDIIRSTLGPNVIFVVLNMNQDDVKERLEARHKGHAGGLNMLMTMFKICESANDVDEEKAINIMITKDMSKQDVVEKILQKA